VGREKVKENKGQREMERIEAKKENREKERKCKRNKDREIYQEGPKYS
jgi:translation initiation factor 3 subunit A